MLHNVLGFIPLFGPPQTTGCVFTAGLVLTIMVLPIVAALSRDLFLTVPSELQEGAAALGATRWEVMRGVVLPSTGPGVAAAVVLGLGRALGEAIAVTQVIGAGSAIHTRCFPPATTLASRIAHSSRPRVTSFTRLALLPGRHPARDRSASTNLLARVIGGRFEHPGRWR